MDYIILILLLTVLCIAIMVAISRWVFRINDIIKRLDTIIVLLQGGENDLKPKTFMEGFKKGMG